jgi:hypothetical protein
MYSKAAVITSNHEQKLVSDIYNSPHPSAAVLGVFGSDQHKDFNDEAEDVVQILLQSYCEAVVVKASTDINPVDIHICSFSHGGGLLKLLVDDKTWEVMESTPIFCGLLEIDSVLARLIISCSSLGQCNIL